MALSFPLRSFVRGWVGGLPTKPSWSGGTASWSGRFPTLSLWISHIVVGAIRPQSGEGPLVMTFDGFRCHVAAPEGGVGENGKQVFSIRGSTSRE